MKEENFIEAEAGTLWKMNGPAIIPMWINPEMNENIGYDALWVDHGHFMKLGKIKTLQQVNKFEKVIFFNQKRNEVVIGYIMQSNCEFLCPFGEEDDMSFWRRRR